MKTTALCFGFALVLSAAHAGQRVSEKRLVGSWKAILIAGRKPVPKNYKMTDEEKKKLDWNSIEFKSNHKFDAMFSAPLSGSWSAKGLKVMLKIPALGDQTVSIKLDPIYLTLSADGKTLTRSVDNEVTVFSKKGP